MGRIGISQAWWSDPRRSALSKMVGNQDRADGIAVNCWRLISLNDKEGLKQSGYFNELIEVGLIDEDCNLLHSVVTFETSLPATQDTLDLLLPVAARGKLTPGHRTKINGLIGAYVKAYKARYGSNPEQIYSDKAILGKIKDWMKTTTEERAINLIQVYLQIDFKPFVDSFHNLWLFFRHINRISNALDTGQAVGGMDWNYIFGGGNAAGRVSSGDTAVSVAVRGKRL
jgi:hypothetical protein